MSGIDLYAPDPIVLWGDFTIEHWTHSEVSQFYFRLIGLAGVVPFCDQDEIDYITNVVHSTIEKAKNKEITFSEALEAILYSNVLTAEQYEKVVENAKTMAPSIREHFYKQNKTLQANSLAKKTHFN